MTAREILILADDSIEREKLEAICSALGFRPVIETNIVRGLHGFSRHRSGILLFSLKHGGLPKNLLLDTVKENPERGFIVVTDESALDFFPQGHLCDYITRPIERREVEIILRRMTARLARLGAAAKTRPCNDRLYDFSEILGESREIRKLFEIIKKIADAKSTVLITGETGTGKELFARAIHKNGARSHKPLVTVNCAAIAPSLMEAEFFGHVKGAFTHAVESKMGLFEKANGGTIFLDEIGELPLELQVKILRTLQEEEVKRVGSSTSTKIDVRIIAATNKDLEEEVRCNRFREDLFFRLNVVHLHIPPLRARKEDIVLLTHHFIEKYAQRNGRTIRGISPNALAMLKNYSWPGNIRELENAIERTVLLLGQKEYIEEEDLPEFLERRRTELRLRFREDALEKKLSIEAYTRTFVERFQHEMTEKELARSLGITPKTLWEKRRKWGMPRTAIQKGKGRKAREVAAAANA